MRKMRMICVVMLVLIAISLTCSAQEPVSRQATLIETISAAEVLIEATGVYHSPEKRERSKRKDVEDQGVARAVEDAKRSAIYTLSFSCYHPAWQAVWNSQRGSKRIFCAR